MLEYFERRAKMYRLESERGLWSLVRQREYACVARALALSGGLSIIDLGCGAGHYARLLHAEFGVDVLAVDQSPAMIEQVGTLPNWVGRVEDLPETRVFDRALAAGMLEFVDEPAPVFRKFAALTKPGGRLVVLVPCAGLSGAAYKAVHEWQGCPVHIRSARQYAYLGERHGLRLEREERCTPISMVLTFVRDQSSRLQK
jgi:SAM-dependent methyltransferase